MKIERGFFLQKHQLCWKSQSRVALQARAASAVISLLFSNLGWLRTGPFSPELQLGLSHSHLIPWAPRALPALRGHTQANAPFLAGLKLPLLEGHQTGLHAALGCCARSLQTGSEQKHLQSLMSQKNTEDRNSTRSVPCPLLPARAAPLPCPGAVSQHQLFGASQPN